MRDNLSKIFPGVVSGDDEVREVGCKDIDANPFQPRRSFPAEQLEELAQSIKTYGLLQPILIRHYQGRYQLVAGERRLRACILLGMDKIPAVIKDVNDAAMAAMALIENLQRENLDYFEEAEGYQRLLGEFGLTQEVLAQRIGKSQSTIANKMRLLKLSQVVREQLAAADLTERHARALLKLPDDQTRQRVLAKITRLGLNVRQTESLIGDLIADNPPPAKGGSPRFVIKDYRIVLNTIRQAVATIEQIGLKPSMSHQEHDEYFEVRIRLPK